MRVELLPLYEEIRKKAPHLSHQKALELAQHYLNALTSMQHAMHAQGFSRISLTVGSSSTTGNSRIWRLQHVVKTEGSSE